MSDLKQCVSSYCPHVDEIERLTIQVMHAENEGYDAAIAKNGQEIERLTAELFAADLKAKTFEEGYDETLKARLYLESRNKVLEAVIANACGCTEGWDCPICQQMKCTPAIAAADEE